MCGGIRVEKGNECTILFGNHLKRFNRTRVNVIKKLLGSGVGRNVSEINGA